jgi:lysophospholipase L1-like esterase
LLLAVSLASACSAGSKPSPSGPSQPSPIPDPSAGINYTAIGASDAAGVGSSVECVPFFDCPNGMGYVQVATRQLKAKGFTVTLNNLGIPTATIGRDFQDLGNRHNHTVVGNFIESEAPFMTSKATLVTIFAGGNDVNVITGALGAGEGASDQIGYINAQVAAFGADYSALLSSIRAHSTASVRIVAINLPNMGAMPFLANASSAQRQAAQRLSVGMTTTVINPLTAQGVLVIDLMCDPRFYQPSTFSSDGFHPSDAGYALMADEVVAAATTSYRAPQSSCAPMSLIPQ